MDVQVFILALVVAGLPTLLLIPLEFEHMRQRILLRLGRLIVVQLTVFLTVFISVSAHTYHLPRENPELPDPPAPTADESPCPPVEETPEARVRREDLHQGYVDGKQLATGRVQSLARIPNRAAFDAIVRVRSQGKSANYAEGFRLGYTTGLDSRPEK